MKTLITFILVITFCIGCGQRKYKKIKLYYIDGTTETIKLQHYIYSDGSFKRRTLHNGCVGEFKNERCMVKKIKYIN